MSSIRTSNENMKYFILLSLISVSLTLGGQTNSHSIQLKWNSEVNNLASFEGAKYNDVLPELPLYIYQIDLGDKKITNLQLSNIVSEKIDYPQLDNIASEFLIETWTHNTRQSNIGLIAVNCLRHGTDGVEGLKSASLTFELEDDFASNQHNQLRGTEESVLSHGTIFKLAIEETGIHKLTGSFIAQNFGINLADIDPDRIQIFGNKGGKLPEIIAIDRTDDLGEIPTLGVGLEDGTFESNDHLLFYAEGPNQWLEENGDWEYQTNIYDEANYIFVKINNETRKKVPSLPSESLENLRSTYLNLQHYGTDEVNLLGQSISHQGSGQLWVSDEISNSRTKDLSTFFDFQSIESGSPATVTSEFYGRSENRNSYELHVGGVTYSKSMGGVDYDPESTFARLGIIKEDFVVPAGFNSIVVNYPNVGGESEGWIDFVNLVSRFSTNNLGESKIIRDTFSQNIGGFDIPSLGQSVWEVSQYHDVYAIEGQTNAGRLQFSTFDPDRREFCVFTPSNVNLEPKFVSSIAPQNLHGSEDIDMLIVSPSLFMNEALRLAEHRSQHSGYTVKVVLVDHIYNEFSSGRQDPTAIRDYCKLLFDRNPNFKFLLLFGDGSYDWRYKIKSVADQNFIPVYETEESLAPIYAFPTDDYYALLSDDEGNNLRGGLDLATGRLLCKTENEAKTMVDKIIRYETDPRTMGDWRNRQIYLADDEDTNRHVDDVDRIAKEMNERYPAFNQDKIYFDAYEQIATPGGARFPDAKAAINSAMFKGGLVMTYLGHGGPTGLAQERVLQTTDIRSWSNFYNMPIIITATCSFTGYDNPEITTAGEYSVLNSNGGAIAILSTVRAVFAQDNYVLSDAVHEYLYEFENGYPLPLGEIMRRAKNATSSGGTDSNNRKFSLFGDPSMRLAIPRYDVVTSTINNQDASQFQDTLGSLENVTIKGFIANHTGGIMTDFNGIIYPTVFDKVLVLKTKGQDQRSKVKEFELRKNTIFKGSATVESGEFEFTFVVPKDINFEIGQGKISYYATDGESRDANGLYNGLIIGGLGIDTLVDDSPPNVKVFMNDSNFVFGGITSPDPIIYLEVSDDNGINVVGNSIGHDLTAVLDNNTQNTYVLNDFYESKVNDYKEGVVRYPLRDLEEGRHQIVVTVWDIANNFTEGWTEFVVVNDPRGALRHVMSYPNPFMDKTNFAFEHTLPHGDMRVEIEIYSSTGTLVKNLIHETTSEGFRIDHIEWDGTSNSGSLIPKGVYLYKIKASVNVSGSEIRKESEFEQVVVLK